MSFKLNVLVSDPDPELTEQVLSQNRLSHVSKSDILVVRLLPDQALSHATYPQEWSDAGPDKSRLFRFTPNFSQSVVRTMYNLPAELAEVHYRLVLEGDEVHSRGSYCQVVTGYNGEPLRPYRRASEGRRDDYVHPTVSIFSAPKLGVLRLNANAARRHGHLTIRRGKVEIIDGVITVTTEQLFRLDDPRLATHKFDQLPDELATWRPALLAHYERWACDAASCDGHYHLG